jgi:hypothetical protein
VLPGVQGVMRIAAGLVVCLCLWADVRMTVQQLRSFVDSSRRLGHSDKQVADYLKNVSLSERLEAGVLEDMGVTGRTLDALRRLSESSKALPVPAPPPPKPVVQAIPPPDSMEQKRVLEQATEYARDYSKKLPNFICTQVTRRYLDPSGLEFWQRQDVITAKLTFFERKEDYKVVLVNNQMVTTTPQRLGGTTSSGEFGTLLSELFDPDTDARFDWERWATLRGRRMHVFSYSVPLGRSKFTVGYEAQTITTGYRGLVYVDRETTSIMRVVQEMVDPPTTFPIQQVVKTVDYEPVNIAGATFVLPLKAVVRSRVGKILSKNEVEFRMYNRFGTETTITYTPDELAPDQTTEQK